jgi:hypothetical protein
MALRSMGRPFESGLFSMATERGNSAPRAEDGHSLVQARIPLDDDESSEETIRIDEIFNNVEEPQ